MLRRAVNTFNTWPAMVAVTATLTGSDACTALGDLTIVSATATSDEEDDAQGGGDGKTTGDVAGQDGYTTPVNVAASLAFDGRVGERTLIAAPLYHAAAAITSFVSIQSAGAIFVQEDFVPADAVRALSEEKIAVALLVPAMIQFCLVGVPDVASRSFEHLRLVAYGASPIAEQTL
ncbi:MAG: hypothetical protein HC802_22290, partial [Caldilineaceae bacterium]|nr:hypothetical protein [Caldilineaceae bacterium]